MYPFTSESKCYSAAGHVTSGDCSLSAGPRRRGKEAVTVATGTTKDMEAGILEDGQSFTIMAYIKVDGINGESMNRWMNG